MWKIVGKKWMMEIHENKGLKHSNAYGREEVLYLLQHWYTATVAKTRQALATAPPPAKLTKRMFVHQLGTNWKMLIGDL